MPLHFVPSPGCCSFGLHMPTLSTQHVPTSPQAPRPAGSLVCALLTGEAAILAGNASQAGGYLRASVLGPTTSSIRGSARRAFSLVKIMCRLTAAPSLRLELPSSARSIQAYRSIRSTAARLLTVRAKTVLFNTVLFNTVRSNGTSSVADSPQRFHHPLLAQGS
jgi:hypothetical protein